MSTRYATSGQTNTACNYRAGHASYRYGISQQFYEQEYSDGASRSLIRVIRQTRETWCAPASVQNALALYGHRVSQRRLAELMGESGEGCDETDIGRALDALECTWSVHESYHRRESLLWLTRAAGVWPLLLCVDNYDHWVLVAGGVLDRLYVFDPDAGGLGGMRAMRPKTIIRRWRASRATADDGAPYFAIVITRGPRGPRGPRAR